MWAAAAPRGANFCGWVDKAGVVSGVGTYSLGGKLVVRDSVRHARRARFATPVPPASRASSCSAAPPSTSEDRLIGFPSTVAGFAATILAIVSCNLLQIGTYGLLGTQAAAALGKLFGVSVPWWVIAVVAVFVRGL